MSVKIRRNSTFDLHLHEFFEVLKINNLHVLVDAMV